MSSLLQFSALGRRTGNQCGQMVRMQISFDVSDVYPGWLMGSLGLLTALNIFVLLSPPQTISDLLTLMPLPIHGRTVLLFSVAANAVLSMGFEQWGAGTLAVVAGRVAKVSYRWSASRRSQGKMYKAVEGGMRSGQADASAG